MNDLSGAVWRKSTRSNSSNSCVEVASMPDGGASVRDSKLAGASPILRFTKSEWAAFVAGVNDGEFSTPSSDPRPQATAR